MATHPSVPAPFRPVVLIIRDGWGENPHPEHAAFNAVTLARTPIADMLDRDWPRTLIRTSGEDVGLPTGTMGNSEVGHQNIGAGRIVDQELMRITRAIRDGSFFDKDALRAAFNHARAHDASLHLLGLVSDGKVHSDLDHPLALLELARRLEFPGDRVFIHVITDGRDTGPNTGLGYIETLQRAMNQTGIGRIATVLGRYWAMDRDHRWERIAAAYRALTGRDVHHPLHDPAAMPLHRASDPCEVLRAFYAQTTDPNRTGDEFVAPTIMLDDAGDDLPRIAGGDSVIFFNFRGDRPRQLTKAFTLADDGWASVRNGGFERGRRLADLFFCTMTGYETGLPVSAIVFEKPARMPGILGEVVSAAGLTQFRCAETEKFAHVTFFFNDYREEPFPGETRVIVPSPTSVTTYDQQPAMSAPEVCEAVLARLAAEACEALIVVNFANGDMVGHTGRLEAVTRAIECVDMHVGRLIDAVLARGGALIVTADHGNAEQMWNPATDAPHTAHTVYDVPLYVVGAGLRGRGLRSGGRLADIAPTVLALLGLDQPEAMTGTSLLDSP